MFTMIITRPSFRYTTFSFLLFNLNTWEFHLSLLLCIVYICVCISFWFISFYLWLVLVFLFSKVYYGFTPLGHQTSWHYTSRHKWQNFNTFKINHKEFCKTHVTLFKSMFLCLHEELSCITNWLFMKVYRKAQIKTIIQFHVWASKMPIIGA
jgi:hypothetical protein